MKTKITSKIPLAEQYNLPYPEIHQISDSEDGDIRLIGYRADYPTWEFSRWELMCDTIYINPITNKVRFIEPTKSKNKDWVITNDYKVILTDNGVPVINPDYQTTEDVQVVVGYNEETGEPIYETQTVEKEITIENCPFILVNAFDFYYGIRHSKTANMSMPELFEVSVIADDKWGYFDKKENHYHIIDIVKIIWEQKQSKGK